MNQRKLILTIMIIFVALVFTWAADGIRVRAPHPDTPEGSIAPIMDALIPLDFKISSSPGPYCDTVDVDLIIEADEHGNPSRCTWRILDGSAVQLECEDFYDLYYRCDGPACFNLRVVTLVQATGRVLSIKRGHVCLE